MKHDWQETQRGGREQNKHLLSFEMNKDAFISSVVAWLKNRRQKPQYFFKLANFHADVSNIAGCDFPKQKHGTVYVCYNKHTINFVLVDHCPHIVKI